MKRIRSGNLFCASVAETDVKNDHKMYFVSIYKCICICIYIYIYIYICIYIHLYTYICIYVHNLESSKQNYHTYFP